MPKLPGPAPAAVVTKRRDSSVEIDWDACIGGTYSRYNARDKATTFRNLPDKTVEVTLWSNRRFLVHASPAFAMEYQGFMGTYTREIDVLAICPDRPWLFEAWYHSQRELHTYAFHKVVALREIQTGTSISGREMCARMGGWYGPGQAVNG